MKRIIAGLLTTAALGLGIADSAPAATSAMYSTANLHAGQVCYHYSGCSGLNLIGYFGSNYYYVGGIRHETAHWRWSFNTWYFGSCVTDVAVTDNAINGYTHITAGACGYEQTF